MEYHEIGERSEFNGVKLEVIQTYGCAGCFFYDRWTCRLKDYPKYCGCDTRIDNKAIIYKFVEKCKPKDMEQNIRINNVNIKTDNVNHPKHYTWLKDLCGIEVIDITRHMGFCLGNAIKYILRAGHKKEEGMNDKDKAIEDLKKAIFYIEDEINRIEKYE